LTQANEHVETSELADFEFDDPREGLIFAQWVGATLPLDEESYIHLDWEFGSSLVGEAPQPWHSLLSKPAWANERSSITQRRYVKRVYIPWEGSAKVRNRSYANYVKKIKEGGLNPKELIFWSPDNIPADHCFWEYIAACYFRNQGYIVTRWHTSRHDGIPDLCAIRESSIIEPLRKLNLIKSGCFTFELELPRVFGLIETQPSQSENSNTVVIEAESKSVSSGIDQLFLRRGARYGRKPGYLVQGFYDEGYVVGPDYPKYDERVGIISNKEDGTLFLAVCPKKYSETKAKEECIQEFSTYVNLLLLRNFTAEEIIKLFAPYDNVSFYDYHFCIQKEVNKLDFTTLVQMVAQKAR